MNDVLLIALAVLHVLAAARVTEHALVLKEDNRAAVAWIGLAWLSPLIGSALYGVFGVNRIRRKATRLSTLYRTDRPAPETGGGPQPAAPDNLRRIAEVGREVTGRRLTASNAVVPYQDGSRVAAEMLRAIREARHSVALASYIFEADSAGAAFVDALAEATRRGVAVRVLIDGVGGGYLTYPMLRRLRRAGVPAASFLHSWRPWRMAFLNLRNHRKLLVVDGQLAFTGGMNIAAHTLGTPQTVTDTHLRVDGPVVRHLMEAFADDWTFTTGESLSDPCWWPDLAAPGAVAARAVTSGPDEDAGKLETLLGTAIVEARRRIRIVTPYFLPDRNLQMALSLAVLRRIEVEIVIPARSNKALVNAAVRANLRFHRDTAWRIFQTPPPFDHSKLMTVDSALCLIGSSNWDVRSHRLNFELDLECYDTELTAAIDRAIDRKIETARRLDADALDAASRPAKLRDAAARLFLPHL